MTFANFTISESFAFGESYSWRLKEGEIRYRGTGYFANLVLRRIPASAESIAKFKAAIDLLEIWSWRNDYSPDDIGWTVLDGSAWRVALEFSELKHTCSGANAYPSFESPSKTSCNPERFALLKAALHDAFSIDSYIHEARVFEERQRKLSN